MRDLPRAMTEHADNLELRPMNTRAAWKGPEIDYRREAMLEITADEVTEIDAALRHLRAEGDLDFPAITRTTFPLRNLGERLGRLGQELRFGRGFALVRGFPRERYELDDVARIYFGMGAHIGRAMPQSRFGELFGHVINISDYDPTVRGYQYGNAQRMHTDSMDVIGLMCARAARSGGVSRIASAVAVHDHIVRTRPDLARLLYRGFVYRRNELDAKFGTGHALIRHRVASYAVVDGEFSSYMGTNYAMNADKAGDSKLSEIDLEALEMVEKLASSPEFYLDMTIGEGDIQFLNNRLMLHGRTGYDDHPEPKLRRHMLRLWLRIPDWPAMPPQQIVHDSEDHRLWLARRTPYMEFPSRFFSGLDARRTALTS
jgi:hypothetical protein